MWGKGIYFAVNARFSCPQYSYPVNKDVYEVFLANVIIGNTIDTGSNNNPYSKLIEPPAIRKKPGERYDSVKVYTNGSDVYIVYKNVKTFPGILFCY